MAWWRPMPTVYVRRRAYLPGTAVHASPCLVAEPACQPLTPRRATWLVLRREAKRTPAETQQLTPAPPQSAEVAEAIDLAQDFVTLVRQRQPTQLDLGSRAPPPARSRLCAASPQDCMRTSEAVKAGVTLPWSSGPVEGHINRLKLLKRQMFGRAHLDLLSRRFPWAPRGAPGHRPGSQHPGPPRASGGLARDRARHGCS